MSDNTNGENTPEGTSIPPEPTDKIRRSKVRLIIIDRKKLMAAMLLLLIPILILFAYILPRFMYTSLYDMKRTHLVIGGDIIRAEDAPIVQSGEILLPLPVIKQYIDPKVYWDEGVRKVVFTTGDKVITMKTDKLTAMVNAKPVELNIPARVIKGTPYIPIQFLSDVLGINVKLVQSGNVVVIDRRTDTERLAEVTAPKTCIRKKPSARSRIVAKDIVQGQVMRIFGQKDKWYKVRTEQGIVGYIDKRLVKEKTIKIPLKADGNRKTVKWKPQKGKINMAWEYVGTKNPDTAKLKSIAGLDVVSPTWFAMTDKNGTVANKGDIKYVSWAHQKGYKVWGLVTNDFDKDNTHIVLNNTDLREKLIQQLLIYAKLYKLDGINIDFENIYMKDKNMLTQFMRELYPLCRAQGLILSMDVTLRSSSETWSKCYDRKALSEVVDYMAVMAYDQYYSGSARAGSVAQLSWVERGVVRILEEVPEEKILLGLPFYTREWQEELVNGRLKISSRALSMAAAEKLIKQNKAKTVWDEESGQYYAEFMDGRVRHRLWLEDTASLNLKSSLVHKYNLAGTAAWRRGFETENIWTMLADNLKVKRSYNQWAQANAGATNNR